MNILYNGKKVNTDCGTAFEFAKKSGFSLNENIVVVLNGFQISSDCKLSENDTLSILDKTKIPSRDELEFLMASRHTPSVHEKVRRAVVGVAGLGGLGSNIAVMLARLGVGKLILADFDIVEPTNLNRQQYFTKHLGMKKSDAIKELVSNINPYIETVTHCVKITENNALEMFKECDIVCEAFDNPDSKAMLTDTILCGDNKIKLVAASGMAGFGSCNDIVTRKINDRFYICGDSVSGAEIGRGLMSPRVTVCAGHQANQVLRLIMEIPY